MSKLHSGGAWLLALLGALALVACDGKKDEVVAKAGGEVQPAAEAKEDPAPAMVQEAGLSQGESEALQDQLEQEAEEKITVDNAEEMLKKLEAEIEDDK